MKKCIKLSLILILSCRINSYAQVDTIIYYSSIGEILQDNSKSNYYTQIQTHGKNKFILGEYYKINNRWEVVIADVKKVNDSTLNIEYRESKIKKIVIFNKVDSGYLIKVIGERIDFSGIEGKIPPIKTKYVYKGFSKLIYPFIKEGFWDKFETPQNIKTSEEYFKNNVVVSNKNWDNGELYISDIFSSTEIPPQYNGSNLDTFRYLLQQKVDYPVEAASNGFMGAAIIQFVIMEDGSINGVTIISDMVPIMTNAIAKGLQKLNGTWTPGIIKDKPVRTLIKFPFYFFLN